MNDLSSISRSLQDILSSPNQEDESTFTELVQNHLQSPDSNVRRFVLEILQDVITEGSDEEIKARRQFIFGETVLSYLPILLPLRADEPELVKSLLTACFEICSPKEAILALNEACQLLEERAGRVDVSDDEMDMDDDGDDESQLPEVDEIDPEELVNDFESIIDFYGKIFQRMPSIKSTPTLLSVSDAFETTLRALLTGFTTSQAISICQRIQDMVLCAHLWITDRSTDAGGEQVSILRQILYMSATLLVPRTRPKMMQTWFLRRFPQLALKDTSPPEIATSSSTWTPIGGFEAMSEMCLHEHSGHLLAQIKRNGSDSRVSSYAPFSALTLIAYKISPAEGPSDMGLRDSLPPIDDMMVLLASGLGGAATDAAGTVLWDALYRAKVGEVECASTLIEILMPLVTSDPDDLNRLAWFKLIQTLIEKANPGLDQILLLEQLLEPANPYDTLRPQALSILRTLLGAAARLPPSSPTSTQESLFQPTLLIRLPFLPSFEHLSQSISEFLSTPSITFVTEQLMTLWLLHQLDKDNLTGVRGDEWITKMRTSVEEVEDKCREMRAELAEGGVEVGSGEGHSNESWVIQRLEAAVDRLKEVI